MSFSYDNNLLTPLDNIRFNIQDTEEDFAEFSDEEISASYTQSGERVYKTTRNLLQKLIIKFARAPSKIEVDGVRMDNPKQGEIFQNLYDSLEDLEKEETRRLGKGSPVKATGIDRSEFNDIREDTSTVKPRFTQQQADWNPYHPDTSPLDKMKYYWRD